MSLPLLGAGPTSGVPAAFDPSSIASLIGWWKADAITGKSDGDAVGSWVDSTAGGAHPMVQATGAAQPIYKTAIANGKPVLRFDGTDDGMASGLTVSNPFSLFVVYAYKSAASTARRVLNGAGANWLVGPFSAAYAYYNGDFINGPATVQDEFVVHAITQNASGATAYVNGTSAGTNAFTTAPGGLNLGITGAAPNPADSDIGEVLAFNAILSSTNRNNVTAYLGNRWGVTVV